MEEASAPFTPYRIAGFRPIAKLPRTNVQRGGPWHSRGFSMPSTASLQEQPHRTAAMADFFHTLPLRNARLRPRRQINPGQSGKVIAWRCDDRGFRKVPYSRMTRTSASAAIAASAPA
jgi:hypothetical protein